jgi:hypothetical protein
VIVLVALARSSMRRPVAQHHEVLGEALIRRAICERSSKPQVMLTGRPPPGPSRESPVNGDTVACAALLFEYLGLGTQLAKHVVSKRCELIATAERVTKFLRHGGS